MNAYTCHQSAASGEPAAVRRAAAVRHIILAREIPVRKPALCGLAPRAGGWGWSNTYALDEGTAGLLAVAGTALCPACCRRVREAFAAAREAKRMRPEAKARLRRAAAEKAAATAGRRTPATYDPLWWRMALDQVAEEHPNATPDHPGFLHWDEKGRVAGGALGRPPEWARGFDPSGVAWETTLSRQWAAWARFRRLPADKEAVLAEVLTEYRWVYWATWRGPAAGWSGLRVRVWPVRRLCALLAALWPGRGPWPGDPEASPSFPLWRRQTRHLRTFTAAWAAKHEAPGPPA